MNSSFAERAAVRASAGFTLLEMLAVIVLIGVIAGIVSSKVIDSINRGKWDAGKAQLSKLDGAIERYALDNGVFPSKLDDLVNKPPAAAAWRGPYLKPSEVKDPFGYAFFYRAPGEHGAFDIVFYGKDGKPGGSDFDRDAANWE